MKPPPFEYIRATTLQEALSIMAAHGATTSPLAGGQSLMQLLATRQIHPDFVLDLNRLTDLAYITRRGDEIAIGALTRYRAVELSAQVAQALPLLPEVLSYVGHATIRHRGTVGGSLAYGDPAGEFPCAAVLLGATITLAGSNGQRRVPADGFFVGPYRTARSDDEIIVEVSFPVSPPGVTWAVSEFSRRHRDYAVVAALAGIRLDHRGVIDYARLAVAGGSSTVWRSGAAEQLLVGREPTPEVLAQAAATTRAEADPLPSVHAGIEHRRHLVGVMTTRVLAAALAKQTGEH